MSEVNIVHIEEDIEDLIPGYLENRQADILRITALLDTGGFEDICRLGFSMKGSGGGYGFDEISQTGMHIEEAARNGDSEEIAKQVENLAQYLATIKIHFRQVALTNSASVGDS